MTLFDAYQQANKRRASLQVRFADGRQTPDGSNHIRVSSGLHNGHIAYQGSTANWQFIPKGAAKAIEVERV